MKATHSCGPLGCLDHVHWPAELCYRWGGAPTCPPDRSSTLSLISWLSDPGSCPISLQSCVCPEKNNLPVPYTKLSSSFLPQVCSSFCVSYCYSRRLTLPSREIWDCRDSSEGLLSLQASIRSSKSNDSNDNNHPQWLSWGPAVCTHGAGGLAYTTSHWCHEAGTMTPIFTSEKVKKSPKDIQLENEGASTKPRWVSKAPVSYPAAMPPCSSFICPHNPSLPLPRPPWHFFAPIPASGLSVFQSTLKVAARVIFFKNCSCVLLSCSNIFHSSPVSPQEGINFLCGH